MTEFCPVCEYLGAKCPEHVSGDGGLGEVPAVTGRYCRSCGCHLAADTGGGSICGPCRRSVLDGEILTRRGLTAEAVIAVYTSPFDFPNAQDFMKALTNVLDGLCHAYGVEAPRSFDHLAPAGNRP